MKPNDYLEIAITLNGFSPQERADFIDEMPAISRAVQEDFLIGRRTGDGRIGYPEKWKAVYVKYIDPAVGRLTAVLIPEFILFFNPSSWVSISFMVH